MSFSKIPLITLSALMLAGCGDKGPNVTIPSGTAIQVKMYSASGGVLGEVLVQKGGDSTMQQVEASVSQALAKHRCHLGIPTQFDSSISRHVATTANLACDGIETIKIKGSLVDATRTVGMPNSLTLGDTVSFVVTEAVKVQ